MAKINYEFNNSKDIYDDGNIEDELLRFYRDNDDSVNINEDRFFYTTTNIRENIVSWYPFNKEDTVMELGAGLGCVTGALCRKAKKVISVEQSKRRAEVLYNRHKKFDNLEVYVSNFKDLVIPEKVDYILFIGVFEYTKMFYDCENPFDKCLQDMKKYLKEDGKIIIAIENRYGMKYVFGGLEDHYHEKYIGLEGYENRDIQTFGKIELTNLLEKNGYSNIKFSYPFPDYKLPSIIYTDDRLPLASEINQLPIYKHIYDVYNYDYRKFVKGFIENEQFGFFSNSFFVEACIGDAKPSNIIFAKTQNYRKDEYNVYTLITDDNRITKIANQEKADHHLSNNVINHQKIGKLGLKVCNIVKDDHKYNIEYVNGKILTEIISEYCEKKDKESIEREIACYVNMLNSISKVSSKLNFHNKKVLNFYKNKKINILKLGLVDLHMSNIIKNNNEYIIIDQEWVSNQDIPTNYMIYFSIKYLYEWIDCFINLFDRKYFFEKYNITEEEIEIYNEIGSEVFGKELSSIDKLKYDVITWQSQITIYEDQVEKDLKILNNTINDQNVVIENRDNVINDLNQIIHNNNVRIDKQLLEIKQLNETLENIYNSKRWKIIDKLANLKNKILNRR